MQPPIRDIEKYAKNALKRWLKKTESYPQLKKRVSVLNHKNWFADLSLCSSKKMTEINYSFRKKNYPTDILSFPADAFFQSQGVLGDLLICTPVLLKQAKEVGHPWKKEVDVLLVHGILHLLHFDHEISPKESKVMCAWKKKF